MKEGDIEELDLASVDGLLFKLDGVLVVDVDTAIADDGVSTVRVNDDVDGTVADAPDPNGEDATPT